MWSRRVLCNVHAYIYPYFKDKMLEYVALYLNMVFHIKCFCRNMKYLSRNNDVE